MIKSIFNDISQKIIFYLLNKITVGYLCIHIQKTSEEFFFGNENSILKSKITVFDNSFFVELLLNQGMGFAESYMNGKWDTDNLFNILDVFAKNPHISINKRFTNFLSLINTPFNFIYVNTKFFFQKDESKDIQKHYDLSNEMFSLFLDDSMAYSCALFQNPKDSLNDAQINKFQSVINGLEIKSKDKFLDIGFGWGGLCNEVLKNFSCDIDAVTLSEAQLNYVNHNHFSDKRINYELKDFRLIDNKYDKISSIEMLEALNYTQISVFFEKIDNILKPGGKLFVQVITIPESRFQSYKKNKDFIQKYIFPNGMIHPVNRIIKASEKHSNLYVENINDISNNYVTTLNLWKQNFNNNIHLIKNLGYDDKFIKKWNYYFDYCAAGFENQLIGNSQIIFSKPKE